jgi:LysM repeat protein
LFALARAYGTTVEALQAANGLGASTTLQIGQELQLP